MAERERKRERRKRVKEGNCKKMKTSLASSIVQEFIASEEKEIFV